MTDPREGEEKRSQRGGCMNICAPFLPILSMYLKLRPLSPLQQYQQEPPTSDKNEWAESIANWHTFNSDSLKGGLHKTEKQSEKVTVRPSPTHSYTHSRNMLMTSSECGGTNCSFFHLSKCNGWSQEAWLTSVREYWVVLKLKHEYQYWQVAKRERKRGNKK